MSDVVAPSARVRRDHITTDAAEGAVMTATQSRCRGCGEYDKTSTLGMMIDGTLWHEDCWRERMLTGARISTQTRSLPPVNAVRRAVEFESKQRALVRRWLLYRDEIPAPTSDEAKALNDWPKHIKSDRMARIAAALVTLKAADLPADALSVIRYLDSREELIGAGGQAFIVSLMSPGDES